MSRMLSCLIALSLIGVPVLGQSASAQGAAKAIQQTEDDWLQGERTTSTRNE